MILKIVGQRVGFPDAELAVISEFVEVEEEVVGVGEGHKFNN